MKHTVKASVLTIKTDQALLELFSSEAIFILQGHGMTVGFSARLDYPSLVGNGRAKRTMAALAAIVLKDYCRINPPKA
ncbi:MAG: hypothetical protein ABIV07_07215 [Polaromonas sp.]